MNLGECAAHSEARMKPILFTNNKICVIRIHIYEEEEEKMH